MFKARQGSNGWSGSPVRCSSTSWRIEPEAVRRAGGVRGTTRYGAERARLESEDAVELKRFRDDNSLWIAEDHNGSPVYLAPDAWKLKVATEDYPKIRFLTTKEQVRWSSATPRRETRAGPGSARATVRTPR